MKIISLNTWGGRARKDDFLSFFASHANTTDVFCLQEVWSESSQDLDAHIVPEGGHHIMFYERQEIAAVLPNHIAYYRPNRQDKFGLLMMVHKKLAVVQEGEVVVYEHKKGDVFDGDVGNHVRNMQFVTLKGTSGPLTIMNVHGLWNSRGKMDCAERLEQSEKIIDFATHVHHPCIIAGDFSVLPDTASIKMFEDSGFRNLIKEYNILSTRTSYYSMPDKFSDYVFVTKDITVTAFSVLPDEVSDHAPLLIEARY